MESPFNPNNDYHNHQPNDNQYQNMYEQNAENMYQQNMYQQNMYQNDTELEKKASSIKTLGIVSICLSLILSCCCTIAGPIVGIIALVKNNQIKEYLYMLSPQGQSNVNTGKVCAIIGIAIGAIFFVMNLIFTQLGFYDAFMEGFQEGMQSACA